MPELFFPSRNLPVEELFAANDQDAMDAFIRNNIRRGSCSTLTMNSPYCLAPMGSHDRLILNTLEAIPQQNRDGLMCAVDELGDLTTTIAEFYNQHFANLDLNQTRGLAGAGATASQTRLTGFQNALRDYQTALDALHNSRSSAHGRQLAMLRQGVEQKYKILQQRYQVELKKLARHGGKNRGNAINSAVRGITVAERRRGRHLYVSNVAEAQKRRSWTAWRATSATRDMEWWCLMRVSGSTVSTTPTKTAATG